MTDYLKKNKVNICLLLLIAGVISVPLMTDYVCDGTNVRASLSRIEAIKEGFGSVFPTRVGPVSSLDFGYGAAAFQADVFLLIPALLRLLGLGIGISYKIFLLLINIATTVIGYICFEKITGRRDLGLIGSMLYTWCPYRCSDMYINADLGDTVAWTFIPIIMLGLIRVYSISVDRKEYSRIWMTLTMGYSLLAISSATFLLVAVCTSGLICCFMGKQSLRRQTIICAGKTALATLFINAWYLGPMLLRMRDPSNVGVMIRQNFRMSGMYFWQYLTVFPTAGDSLEFAVNGQVNAQTMGVGIAVVLLVLFYLWCLFVKEFKDRTGVRMMCVIAILVILSCNFFPWDLLQNSNMLFSILLALLQSPAKWGVAVCGGLIWMACRMLKKLSESENEKFYKIVLVVTVAISLATTQYMTGTILSVREYIRPDTEEWGRISLQALAQESMVWRACEAISAVTLCGLLIRWIMRRRKGVKRI